MPEPKEVKVEARKGVIEVNVTSNVTSRKIKFPFNVGNTIAEAIKLYGEDVVFSAWVEQVVIKAQGNTNKRHQQGKQARQGRDNRAGSCEKPEESEISRQVCLADTLGGGNQPGGRGKKGQDKEDDETDAGKIIS